MILAAIDIGSNAARLLINEVRVIDNNFQFDKLNLIRVPLRLGMDVFEQNAIGKEREKMIMSTMKAFKHLMDAYGVNAFRACATSAMRDANNASTIVRNIKMETGIAIEVISGDEEAMLVYENHIEQEMDITKAYLYIDVGGGSTEITIYNNGELLFKKSFNIGTIRLLKQQVTQEEWISIKNEIQVANKNIKKPIAIGSGGNINKIFSVSKKKDGKPLSLDLLKDYYKELSQVTLQDRIKIYKLRSDRADVIVPALEIYINIMKWCGAEEIFVPKIGLADGLIHKLATENMSLSA